jgi:cytochrome c oxidase subunit 4
VTDMVRELSKRHYVGVWALLLALTGISWGVSYAHLGAADLGISLVIAVVKSTLVLLFFMHLVQSRFSNAIFPLGAILLIGLLVLLMSLDVATRRTFPRAPEAPLDDAPLAEPSQR